MRLIYKNTHARNVHVLQPAPGMGIGGTFLRFLAPTINYINYYYMNMRDAGAANSPILI